MRSNYFVSCLVGLLLYASGAVANVCNVPGSPTQWVTDRCMIENDTADPKSAAVVECIRRSEPLQPCELNASYKKAYCQVLISKGQYKGTADACVADAKVTGSIPKGGV